MKIHHIVDRPPIALTNEEHQFVDRHPTEIALKGLYDRDLIIAQTLVRKGIYEISTDKQTLLLQHDDQKSPKNI